MSILEHRDEQGSRLPMLVWRFAPAQSAVSSAPLGGGFHPCQWIINATVPMDYARLDPERHLTELAAGLDLRGPGVGMLTGVDVTKVVKGADGGVRATATVGISSPAWAAAPDGHLRREPPGTINIVVELPVRLTDAALVNAVVTATEAKSQALWDLRVAATGTASDAICVICPINGPAEAFGGPRSVWGARLARAVHQAVRAGGGAWLAG